MDDFECISVWTDRRLYTHMQYHEMWFFKWYPPWCGFWVMNAVVKVQNPNSSGWDLFSFPLITKQLLTDSQHSQHSHNVFLAFQTGRQTDRVRKEKRWKLGSKILNGLKWDRKRLCGSGGTRFCSLLSWNTELTSSWDKDLITKFCYLKRQSGIWHESLSEGYK